MEMENILKLIIPVAIVGGFAIFLLTRIQPPPPPPEKLVEVSEVSLA